MNIINEILIFSKPFIKENELDSFTVSCKKHLEVKNEKKRYPYNKLIREKVKNDYGVYLWTKNDDEIIYIGMAGKLKGENDNTKKEKIIVKGGHFLSKRLIATRGKDDKKKDIPTRKYLKDYMEKNNIKELKFYILYTKKEVPTSYLEARLLYEYYTEKGKLPELNKSF